ncbi:MAG: carbon-nitrogen hydrolase family protein [SAR202 cluster bacterium]|nr:carbon-nitrogen hydrolase family protein [SAR202 cluster bacterium]
MRKLRISFLHLAPVTGDIDNNRKLVERGVTVAAEHGAQWVVTPELCIPGYLFMEKMGTDWIVPQPDPWMNGFLGLVKQHALTVFLSHPERDTASDKMYNTVFVIDKNGEIIGKHRKVKALGGAESWSTSGWKIDPIECDGIMTGILICADGYKNEIAQVFKDKGAQLLISPVAWGPGHCGPDGEWEARSADTGLPMMVCNRSGNEDGELDYSLAESVVTQNGKRILEATSDRSVVLSFDWDIDSMSMLSDDFDRVYL